MNKKLAIILILLAVTAFSVGIYFLKIQNSPNYNSEDEVYAPEIVKEDEKKLYVDSEFGYSIKIPEEFRVESEGKYSKRFVPDKEILGMGPTNFIYVSVVTPEVKENVGEVYNYDPNQFNKLIALENIGDSANLVADDIPELGEWYTYTIVSIEDIDMGVVKGFENTKPWEFPSGTTENRYIYGTEKNIYILGYYTGGDSVSEELRVDPRVAYEVTKSFQIIR